MNCFEIMIKSIGKAIVAFAGVAATIFAILLASLFSMRILGAPEWSAILFIMFYGSVLIGAFAGYQECKRQRAYKDGR